MEITKERRGDFVEVKAAGRLDEHWSSHLANGLDETIREGAHRIRLNMSAVTYLSSAGIGVLVAFHKKLSEIEGVFSVTEPSPMVRKVLDLTHLSPLLIKDEITEVAPVTRTTRIVERGNVLFRIVDLDPDGRFECRIIGDEAMLQRGGYRPWQAETVEFTGNRLGIGLGAFGAGFEDCRSRYGEFLAVAGAAAYLPTDGSSVPDYMVATGSLMPEVSVLNAIVCEGQFAYAARFAPTDRDQSVALSELVEAALAIANADSVAVTMVVETTGLVGVALRKSPAQSEDETTARFAHPEIRKWISFTGEPAHAGSLCIVVGIASRSSGHTFSRALRPMSKAGSIAGHFHAAACRYRPIKKRETNLEATVKLLMEAHSLQGVLHLLPDHRQAEGAGESQFTRGLCWISPLREAS